MTNTLQEQIAATLEAHSHVYDSDCGEDFGCGGCEAIDAGGDIYGHQAEEVMKVIHGFWT